MQRKFLKKYFDYNDNHDIYYKESKNKEPMGEARVQLLNEKRQRIGKFYWDKIEVIYDFDLHKKPILQIYSLNGFTIIFNQNNFSLYFDDRMEDTCYINNLSSNYENIEFYGEFEWKINKMELRK